jgi:hypothetical protein
MDKKTVPNRKPKVDRKPTMGVDEARRKTNSIKKNYIESGRLLKEIHVGRGWESLGYKYWTKYLEAEIGIKRAQVQVLMSAYDVSVVTGLVDDYSMSINARNAICTANKPGKNLSVEDAHNLWQRDYRIIKKEYPDLTKATESVVRDICDQTKCAEHLGFKDEDWEVGSLSPITGLSTELQEQVHKKLLEIHGDNEQQSVSLPNVQKVVDAVLATQELEPDPEPAPEPAPEPDTSDNSTKTLSETRVGVGSSVNHKDSLEADDNLCPLLQMQSLVGKMFELWSCLTAKEQDTFQQAAVQKAIGKGLFFKLGVNLTSK